MQLFALCFVAAVNKQGLTLSLHEEVNSFFNLPSPAAAQPSHLCSVYYTSTLVLQWSKSEEGEHSISAGVTKVAGVICYYICHLKCFYYQILKLLRCINFSFNDIRGVQDIICSIYRRILIVVSSVETHKMFLRDANL